MSKAGKNWNPLTFLADNAVPIVFIAISAVAIPLSGFSVSHLVQELLIRIGRNSFLILSLLIPIMAGMGLNFGMVLGAMAGQIGLILISDWAIVGILVYEQSFGFIQLYMGPFYMALPAVASILLGGASVNKASIVNVIVGTFLFQGILTMTPSVINSVLQTDMSEVIRIIVSNGMILYALTRKVRVKR